ncbi:MAG TPA: hypothetical protein VLF20_01330, partial [Patescibacteria group bacterium]|nr:hypothetical protein [Patescibacteria group bacterium]
MAERGKERRTRSSLPLFRGTSQEVSTLQHALRSFDEARDTRRGLEFQSVLPQVIGFVPVQERGFLTSFVPQGGLPTTGVMLASGDPDFERFLAGMP